MHAAEDDKLGVLWSAAFRESSSCLREIRVVDDGVLLIMVADD